MDTSFHWIPVSASDLASRVDILFFSLVAITGFVVLPGVAIVWAVAAGATNGALLPLVLALPFDFNSDAVGVARTAAAMQGVGYALAAATPIALGGVRDLSGSFGEAEVVLAIIGWCFVASVLATAAVRTRVL